MILKGFSLSLFLLLANLLSAQVTLSGIIINESTKEPIAEAEIYCNQIGLATSTETNGKFTIEFSKAGTYSLSIFAYSHSVLQVSVKVMTDTTVIWKLTPLSQELPAVVVQDEAKEASRLKNLRSVEGTSIYAGKKTEVVSIDQSVANISGNNSRQLYAQVAGLTIFEGNNGGLQLNIGGRGLDPNRTSSFNTRQNGYDISADVLGYPESYYTPPAEAISEIQVIRGAASLQYGTQFGGLVNFKMRDPNPRKKMELISRQSVASFSGFSSFNSLSGTKGKLGYYTYFHHKQGNGFRPNSGYSSQNAYAHIRYAFSSRTKANVDVTYLHYLAQQPGGITDAQFYQDPTFSNRNRNWFQVDWRLFSAKLEHKFSVKTQLSINVFALNASRKAVGFRTNRVSQPDELGSPRDLLSGSFRNGGAEAKLLTRYKFITKPSVFLVGAKVYQSRNRAIQGPGSAGTEADFEFTTDAFPHYPSQSDFTFPNQNVAAFSENIWWATPKLTITPGLRFEYINTSSEGKYRRIDVDLAGNPIRDTFFQDNRSLPRHFLLGGVGISYKPTDCIELVGNISQNYRSVTFNDIRVVNPSYQIDPDISDEHGYTIDVALRGLCAKFLSYDAGVFALSYNDRLGEVLRNEQIQNANGDWIETNRIVRFRGNIGQAFIYGLEAKASADIRQKWWPTKKNLKLSWFVNGALTKSQYLSSKISGITGNEVEFVPLVNLKSGVNFGVKNLMGSLQITYLSQQFTDASNAPQNELDNQRGIEGTIPAYHVVDLSLSYTYKRFKFESGLNNMFNRYYFTRRATGYPGPGIIPSDPISGYFTVQVKI